MAQDRQEETARLSAPELRARIRAGTWTGPTPGFAHGYEQANLVILPVEYAADFAAFCRANARACPVFEVTEPGDPEPPSSPGADLRTDLPRYEVYRDGELVDTPVSIEDLWLDDLVAFLIGCSYTFEQGLIDAGIPLRHVEQGRNVAMYRTSIPCEPVGPFSGDLIVSMRPVHRDRFDEVVAICERYPHAHGAPLGTDPAAFGIRDLKHPEFGDPVAIHADEVPVFWACGVTATNAAISPRPRLVVAHAPGHMFVTDRRTLVGSLDQDGV